MDKVAMHSNLEQFHWFIRLAAIALLVVGGIETPGVAAQTASWSQPDIDVFFYVHGSNVARDAVGRPLETWSLTQQTAISTHKRPLTPPVSVRRCSPSIRRRLSKRGLLLHGT